MRVDAWPARLLWHGAIEPMAWLCSWPGRFERAVGEAILAEIFHVSDYFCVHAHRRELPARHIGAVEAVLGNTVISQWIAQQSHITVLEELQAQRSAAMVAVA